MVINMKLSALILVVGALLTGCATRPPQKPEISGTPTQDSNVARVYFSAGTFNGPYRPNLWSVNQVGPVTVDNTVVGSPGEKEHVIVDLPPGSYVVKCTPHEPDKNFSEPVTINVSSGQTRYFACDQAPKGIGMAFGLIGVLLSEHVTKTYPEERPLEAQSSKLVAYTKLPNKSPTDPVSKPGSKKSSDANKDVSTRMKSLNKLKADGLITDQEYQQKKAQILNQI